MLSKLKRKGFKIIIATDGEMGVEMASSENPDLILMDLGYQKWMVGQQLKQ